MKRLLVATGLLVLALAATGCGDKGTSGGQPRLSNPDDPKLKGMQPASPNGGVKKAQQTPVAQ